MRAAVLDPMIAFVLLMLYVGCASAWPATVPFQECMSNDATDPSGRIKVSSVYAQLANDQLRMTVLGQTQKNITGSTPDRLATLFTTTSFLTFTLWQNSSFFCNTLRPPSSGTLPNINTTYCPLAAGDLAFAVSAPLAQTYELSTINTRIRVVDESTPAKELTCIDVATTRLGGDLVNVYGRATIILWVTVGITIAYWAITGAGRISAAWDRAVGRPGRSLWHKVERVGFMFASAIGGDTLSSSPALLRFATPSARDVILHTQWCAALAMISVEWPEFVYPILSQTAWSTLVFNVTLVQGESTEQKHWYPLNVPPYNPPATFAPQLSDPSSPLFLDNDLPNVFLNFPQGTSSGMPSFAAAVGLRPEDLFGTSLSIFLLVVAGIIVLSLLIWALDILFSHFLGGSDPSATPRVVKAQHRYSASAAKELGDLDRPGHESSSGNPPHPPTPVSRGSPVRRWWWTRRARHSSFHGSILQGNLVRLLVIFHFPIIIFTCYQFTLNRDRATTTSLVLSAIAFAALAIIIPTLLIYRIATTPTSKLFDASRTLLALGPLYNRYAHDSQLFSILFFANNLAIGVTIGAGQASGTAQSIVILTVEVVSALITSIWLPYGRGAHMGLISFLFCVARIITAVLLVILSPTVSIGAAAGGWVTYAILGLQGLVYAAFLIMLFLKGVEGLIRIIRSVPFSSSKRASDTGLMGACAGKNRNHTHHRYRLSHLNRSSAGPHHTLDSPSIQKQPATGTPTGTVRSSNFPPSFLRPEHAARPYREDSDDETGYIMSAWQPFPQMEYSPPSTARNIPSPASDAPSAPKSGFTRVGGGRAHFDSPYAIAAGTAPHGGQTSKSSIPLPDSPRQPGGDRGASSSQSQLPPGAFRPLTAHARTKSQTAVIEYITPPQPASASSSSRPTYIPMPPQRQMSGTTDDDSSVDSPEVQPKRKPFWSIFAASDDPDAQGSSGGRPWNFRNRRKSDGGLTPTAEEVRSFVVVREPRPATATGLRQSSRPTTAEGDQTPTSNAPPSSYPHPIIPPRSTRRLSSPSV